MSFLLQGKVHGDHYPGLKTDKKLKGALGDINFGSVFFKFLERGLFEVSKYQQLQVIWLCKIELMANTA